MQNLKFLFTFLCSISLTFGFCQFRGNNIGGYTFSVQVDSSHYFIIGSQPNKTERTKYALEDRNQQYDNYSYSGEVKIWSNAFVYDDSTKKLKKMFDFPLVAVYAVHDAMQSYKYFDSYYQRSIMSGVTKENIVFAVKTDSYNGNGVIDLDDPVYLFISKKDGTDCKQITPSGMNVTSWRLTKEGMGIILAIQPDQNGDKKFLEDEELYEIDLNSNIAKIKIKPISN